MGSALRGGAIVPHPDGARRSPLGYAVHADGLRLVLDRLHAELPGQPLLICEHGIGTDDDDERAQYLRAGLDIARSARPRHRPARVLSLDGRRQRRVAAGYDVAFGLIDRERRVRGSANVLRDAVLE